MQNEIRLAVDVTSTHSLRFAYIYIVYSLVLISQNKEVTSDATTHSVMQMCTTCLL